MANLTRYLLSFVFLISFSANVFSSKISTRTYIRKYKKLAIAEMKKYKIPASITLAQGILESGSGNSTLARKANNHFGIKCHDNWRGKTMKWDDDARNECFRKYKSVADSYRDHSKFLKNRGRYSFLFKLKTTDYRGWAKGLQKAGYATNQKYSVLLIKVIEENRLYRYDDKKYQRKVIKGEDLEADTTFIDNFDYPDANDFDLANVPNQTRKIYTNNGVRFIFAEEGDTFEKIAKDFQIYSWQIPKYNDLDKNASINEGQMIYIQPKKNRGSKKYHIVQENETLYSISQLYGITLEKLCKKNHLSENDIISKGQQLKLK